MKQNRRSSFSFGLMANTAGVRETTETEEEKEELPGGMR